MNPLVIYVGLIGLCLAVLVIGWVFRARTTRTCPLCGSKVDLGKVRCQTCGYRFTTARM